MQPTTVQSRCTKCRWRKQTTNNLKFTDMVYYVIEGENMIFATYGKTICFQQQTTKDNHYEVLTAAKACAFDYARNQVRVMLSGVNDPNIKNADDVFSFLDKMIAD